MNNRREKVRKEMIQKQITEIRTVVTNMEDALNGARFREFNYTEISTTICSLAIKNLKDFEKKYLIGQITEG